jgi:hypothetical protein
MPGITDEPPVSTMPDDSTSSKPERRSSAWISSNSSSTRGWMTSASARRDSLRERPIVDAGDVEHVARIGEIGKRAAELALDLLGFARRRAQRHRDVVGDLVAGDRNHRGVADRALREDRESVVPPPMSIRQTPRSFSSSDSTA